MNTAPGPTDRGPHRAGRNWEDAAAKRALPILIACCLGLQAALASAETFVDPENTPATGRIVDPENTPATGRIVDPENPSSGETLQDPENTPGGTRILDDQNQTAAPTPTAAAPFVPSTIFQGAFSQRLAVDTARDVEDEATWDAANGLQLRLRHRFSSRWSVTLEGALDWRIFGAPDDGVIGAAEDRTAARLDATLGDAYVAGRAGAFLFRIGNMRARWGVLDLVRPADVVQARDLRGGATGTGGARAMPMADVTWVQGAWTVQALVIPFFVPDRIDLTGTDEALARPGTGLPVGLIRQVVHPSMQEYAQPLLARTELPDERPQNVSAGLRTTVRAGGFDVAAGYLFGWDRTPFVEATDSFRDLAAVLGDAEGIPELTPDLFAALGAVQSDLDQGETLLRGSHRRRHDLTLDAVRYVGPVGLRLEGTFSPARSWIVEGLRSVERPGWAAAGGLSYENASTGVLWIGEAMHQRAVRQADDPAYLFGFDQQTVVATALRWDPQTDSQGRWAPLTLELGGVFEVHARDLALRPRIEWAWSESTRMWLDAVIITPLDAPERTDGELGPPPSIGEIYDRNDQVGFGWERVF